MVPNLDSSNFRAELRHIVEQGLVDGPRFATFPIKSFETAMPASARPWVIKGIAHYTQLRAIVLLLKPMHARNG